jgi:hypothetical protein
VITAVQVSVLIAVGVFGGRPARRPQLTQRRDHGVQVGIGNKLVHLVQPPRGTGDKDQDPPLPPGRLDPLADRHPPSLPAAFRKLDTIAVLTARLLPAPRVRQ